MKQAIAKQLSGGECIPKQSGQSSHINFAKMYT